MSIQKYLLKLKNIPEFWVDPYKLSIAKKQKIQKLSTILKQDVYKSIYVQGCPNILFKEIYNKTSINQILGIDFIEYFNNTFNKDKEAINTVKYNFIYNIGIETALNPKFSQKLLLGLLYQTRKHKQVAIFVSPLSYTDFYQQYKIEFANKIAFPQPKEESII